MARIRDAKGWRQAQPHGGYTRLFGSVVLRNLPGRVPATVISAGSELERLILEREKHVTDFDEFISDLAVRGPCHRNENTAAAL